MIKTLRLEESESIWNDIVKNERIPYPFYTHEWHRQWKKTLSPSATVMVYHNDDVLISLVLANNDAHFSGGEEIADYLDAIGREDKKEAFWQQLLPHLQDNGIKQLLLRNIPAASPTKDVLLSLGAHADIEDMTPTMMLKETDEAYLESLERKNRHEFKRKVKKFELTYPQVQFSVLETIDIPSLLGLMKRDEDKKTFLTKEMEAFFSTLPTLKHVNTLQATAKTKEGVIVASSLFFVVDKTLLLYNSGFDTTYQGSGLYLKAKTILWAIKNGYKEYNFLQGQERYKYELGAKDIAVYKIQIAL